ncbi:GNAT family N-acetyltransferase [Paenibacillus piri]|uniref:GNAT family N-acetyltransferase n=1 Tax=Paenibacillus piri TaxID=2547395 RepID=A0A4R5KX56_9BACL|nr:GNAT family N-acetyltransferase [Paenibacillus piri]TDF99765.1 GNAT family N-acetyltransferase [Paenibacillus piri]
MGIEIVALEASLVAKASRMVSGYLFSSSNGTDEPAVTPELAQSCVPLLERLLSSGLAELYMAVQDGQHIGFMLLSWSFSMSKGRPVLRVEALYTSPDYRNQGIGKKLLQYAVGLARTKQAVRLQLETDETNVPARVLYEDLGFEKIEGKGVYMLFL